MKHHLLPARDQRGVTFIEICVVVAIMAVVMASALPSMQTLIDVRRLDGAATQLATDIQFARAEAVARNQPLRLSLHAHANGSCYLIHTGGTTDCRCQASGPAQCDADAQVIKTVVLGAEDRISLESNTASVLFNPVHGTSSPAATLRLFSTQGRAVHHVVNVMGRIRSCSPRAVMPGYRAC